MIIGLGTGAMYKLINPASLEAIKAVEKTGANAIELCGVRMERFHHVKHSFINIEDCHVCNFDYVSLHAPNDHIYRNDNETLGLLYLLRSVHDELSIDNIVIHPELVEDFSVFEKVSLPLAFENMDWRKKDFKTVEQMKRVFDYGKMVLDVTHAYTCDKSMDLCLDLIKAYLPQIAEIHCSGHYVHGEDEQQHFPASLEKDYWDGDFPHTQILSCVPANIPIIIESVFPKDFTNMQVGLNNEYNYIKKFLS